MGDDDDDDDDDDEGSDDDDDDDIFESRWRCHIGKECSRIWGAAKFTFNVPLLFVIVLIIRVITIIVLLFIIIIVLLLIIIIVLIVIIRGDNLGVRALNEGRICGRLCLT